MPTASAAADSPADVVVAASVVDVVVAGASSPEQPDAHTASATHTTIAVVGR